ncbi:hypothetical protein [Vibrio renipiscarius]|uniref:Uncharacterized protein n=1 Tax=Vibrio renipiscarius TaxID=1461322 RepID=A0A0C2N8V3_9VIBR|nr:hypothetical protein [Vibrio renipiscarius]KII76081.1 hypothetical protein OJ16_14760 [Vibrio renipiscarius]KII79186.1 hypothetical protein PL18_10220 [Vibrio renipiscarius]
MKHSLKHIWVTIFSIFAMLMSNYVSSAPAMTMGGMQSKVMISPEQAMLHHAQTSVFIDTHSINQHAKQDRTGCHSVNDNPSALDSIDYSLSNLAHCSDSGTGVDDCCTSVCSSVSCPIAPSNGLQSFSSSLALHQSVKIGDKVTRIQNLLRPPSL